MENVIPVLYSEYGRYLSRFRAIPFHIDLLKPVERRLLLTLFQDARTKLTKSAKIVGNTIAKYHPHGDLSTYESLIQLVRGGFARDDGGSWGGPGLEERRASASRYTETQIEKWIEKLAFEFIDFVPWVELELDPEPLFLPSPIPIGLIGDGIISGISFYKTVIPKYTRSDLIKRLKWLIENKTNYKTPKTFDDVLDENIFGPKIIPQKRDCEIKEANNNDFYKLLFTGEGELIYIPNGKIETIDVKKGKKTFKTEMLLINGCSPMTSFDRLVSAIEEGVIEVEKPFDLSKKQDVSIALEPKKKNIDFNELFLKIWSKYLIKKINFKCYTCDDIGVVEILSIDRMILNSYKNWKNAWLNSLIHEIDKINEKIYFNEINGFIKKIVVGNKNQINSVKEIIELFDFSKTVDVEVYDVGTFKNKKFPIKEDIVRRVCRESSIEKLIEHKDFKTDLLEKYNKIKEDILNIDSLAYSKLDSYL